MSKKNWCFFFFPVGMSCIMTSSKDMMSTLTYLWVLQYFHAFHLWSFDRVLPWKGSTTTQNSASFCLFSFQYSCSVVWAWLTRMNRLSPSPSPLLSFVLRLWERRPLTFTLHGLKSSISVRIISAFSSLASAAEFKVVQVAQPLAPVQMFSCCWCPEMLQRLFEGNGFDRSQKVTVTQRWILWL